MNREQKKRKRRFWVLCLAAVLLMYNILPMTAYAAEYKEDEIGYTTDIYPGDVLCMQKGQFDGEYGEIQYVDENDCNLVTDTLIANPTEIHGETYYKGTVKTYAQAGGAEPEERFVKWKIYYIYRSGGWATRVSLKAVMSTIQRNIRYELDGGTTVAPNPSTYWEGTKVALNDAKKTGYTFGGWFMDAGHTEVYSYDKSGSWTGDVTLYAKFTPNTYAITYELDGGSNAAANPATYTYGTGVPERDFVTPAKTGNTFEGWYSDAGFTTKVTSISATHTGDVQLYAKFTPNNYTITYNLDGGVNAASNPASYTYGTGVAGFTAASKTGYTFEGWYSDASFTMPVASISATDTGDVTLYAKFTPESYEITYNLDGGVNAASNPASYTYGTGVTGFADASKTGYTFDGWYSDAAFTARVTSISAADMGNKTLYAKFTANASTPTPNPGVTPTPTPNPGVTETPTPAPAATETAAPSATETPAAMEKDDVPKTGGGMLGVVPVGVMLLSGIGLMIVGRRKSFTDEKQG